MTTTNPYRQLGPEAFWKTGVADHYAEQMPGLWDPAFPLRKGHKVATFGSCFAQHISRALKAAGYSWFDAEPLPSFVSPDEAARFNYGVYSARTGNIYTAADLRQWLEWAAGEAEPPAEAWERGGRFFDPFRPAIEPDGFASAEEVQASRRATLAALRRAAEEASVFVFTLGLTEGWRNRAGGYSYAMCPGTVAGEFDPDAHQFVNQDYPAVLSDMRAAFKILRRLNPGLKVLLTVSPVPLTATASGQHVLLATTYSKSVLRAVAGYLAATVPWIDYFPSYEIITAPPFRGRYFMPNQRGVAQEGVDFVMRVFLRALEAKFRDETPQPPLRLEPRQQTAAPGDLKCEEEMLAAFGA